MRHNPCPFDSFRYLDKNMSKAAKQAKNRAARDRGEQTRQYEWIAHVQDHFTKFHVFWIILLNFTY